MKVLLVGGFGFLGKRFIRKYSDSYELIIYGTENSVSRAKNLIEGKHTVVVKGSVEDGNVAAVIDAHKPDVVVHLAALTGLEKCEEKPNKAFGINVYGTLNVVMGCARANSKLIFVSSREVYGETLGQESSEDDKLIPNNIYGITKMIGEYLVIYGSQKYGIDYTILRPTNVYGPEGNCGINKIVKAAVVEGRIEIFGGDQILNFIYVDDVIELIRMVLSDKRSSRQIFNVGSKDTLTMKQFAEKLSKVMKKNITVEYYPKRQIETSFFNPSIEKLEKKIEFSPETDLEQGLGLTIKWQMEHLNKS